MGKPTLGTTPIVRFELKPDCQVTWLPFLTRSVNLSVRPFANDDPAQSWKAWEVYGFGVHLLSPEKRLFKFPYSALICLEYVYDPTIHGPKRPPGRPPKEGTDLKPGADSAGDEEHPVEE